jgi:hypothetical protein
MLKVSIDWQNHLVLPRIKHQKTNTFKKRDRSRESFPQCCYLSFVACGSYTTPSVYKRRYHLKSMNNVTSQTSH